MPKLTLREARGLLGITQQQLADRAGQKRSVVDDIETGRTKRPNYVTVINIFRALQQSGLNGIAIDDVFPVEPLPESDEKALAS